jgi:hypothetical protein
MAAWHHENEAKINGEAVKWRMAKADEMWRSENNNERNNQ